MGKESRIGLAIVGVLLGAFLGLLIRKYFLAERPATPSAEPAPAASAQLSPVRQRDEPTVVTAQRDEAGQTIGRSPPSAWAHEGTGQPGVETADVPHGSFMPREAPPADRYQVPQYADDTEDVPLESDVPTVAEPAGPSAANPFSGGLAADSPQQEPTPSEPAAMPNQLDVAPRGAAALDARKPPARSTRNPLRRLSAEVPIDEAPGPEVDGTAERLDDAELAPQFNVAPPAADPLEPAEPEPPAAESFDDAAGAALEPATVPFEHEPTPFEDSTPVAPSSRYQAQEQYQVQDTAPSPLAPAAAPSRPADGRYTIEPNDNLWTISENVYGTGRYFKAIFEHNRATLKVADRLTAGEVIEVPPTSELEERYPDLCPKQRRSAVVKSRTLQASAPPPSDGDTYVVMEGDTLFDIARYELGKASRWGEIYELNRDVLGEDFDYLQPGLELRMPAGSPTNAAREPESRYLR